MTYSLVGSGNMAAFLAASMHAAGHVCTGIWSRNAAAAALIAGQYHLPLCQSIAELHDGPDAILLAVPDSALEEIAAYFPLRTTTLVHTSGSADIALLQAHAVNCAVLWPLYSILKNEPPASRQFPSVWEANTDEARKTALALAMAVSDIQYEADSNQRRWLHLAAVLGNNFLNYLLSIATDICAAQDIPASLLRPILQQTIDRSQIRHPDELQTGPARRNDTATIGAHLQLLEGHPNWQRVYEVMTDAIRRKYIV